MVHPVEGIFQNLVRLALDGTATECAPLIPGNIGATTRGDIPIRWNVVEDFNERWIRKHCNGNAGRIHTSVAFANHIRDLKIPWRIDQGRIEKRPEHPIARPRAALSTGGQWHRCVVATHRGRTINRRVGSGIDLNRARDHCVADRVGEFMRSLPGCHRIPINATDSRTRNHAARRSPFQRLDGAAHARGRRAHNERLDFQRKVIHRRGIAVDRNRGSVGVGPAVEVGWSVVVGISGFAIGQRLPNAQRKRLARSDALIEV